MLDVVVLFFLFGLLAGLVRSELKLPPALYDTLSLFLLLAIGLKGGVGLAQQSLQPLLPQLALVILLGVVQTLLGFAVLRLKMNRVDAAATAAHYGSVSVATFAVGVNWLTERGISFESQLSIFLAVMEIPAILVGIVLARGISRETRWRMLAHETFLGKGVTLLLGGMAIGYLAGPDGIAPLKPLFVDLFKGALALFLLEMGLIVARQCQDLRKHGFFLLGFALLMPLASAGLGLAAGQADGAISRRTDPAGDPGGQRLLYCRAGYHAHRCASGQPGALPQRRAGGHLPVQHHAGDPALPQLGPPLHGVATCRPRPAPC